jgi:hypothetical protein
MKQFAAQLIVTFYTEWEEYYRPALAAALDCDAEAIRLDYFGDVRNMRQDYVHSRGVCKNSARSKVLKWFAKDQTMIPTPETTSNCRPRFIRGTQGEAATVHQRSKARGGQRKSDDCRAVREIAAASSLRKDAALDQAAKAVGRRA